MKNERRFLSRWRLDRENVRRLKLWDAYAVHKAVYGLFPIAESAGNRILYCDQAQGRNLRDITMLSSVAPRRPDEGRLETRIMPAAWLEGHRRYRFMIRANPIRRSGGRICCPLRSHDEIESWFKEKGAANGFNCMNLAVADIRIERFMKRLPDRTIRNMALHTALLYGLLEVEDADRFVGGAFNGVGHGKAFGCGLLQLEPY